MIIKINNFFNMKSINFWSTLLEKEEANAAQKAILNKNISQGTITEVLENELSKILKRAHM